MTFSIQRLFAPLLILVPVLALAACGGTDTTPDDGDAVAAGAELVKSSGCNGCHTSKTASDGVLSGQDSSVTMSSTSGPNLTPDNDTGIGTWTAAQITAAIRTGVDEKGATLCASMPKYDKLTDDEAASIAAYLKSIPAVKRVLPAPTCQ
jgi:mono/diheme cytochrome c family protein